MVKYFVFMLLIAILAGCSGDAATPDNAAGAAVQRYLQAKVDGDADTLSQTLCAEREGDARREAASFAALDASLEEVMCTYNPDDSTVTCSGRIVATYNGENRNIDLPRYSVVQEDGEWKVCGEA